MASTLLRRAARGFSPRAPPAAPAPPQVQLPAHAPAPPRTARYRYFVPRNARGSLPVYTDVRNGGTKHLVLVRNVEGDASALAADLQRTLFAPDAPEAARLAVQAVRQRHLVLTGGQWKHNVMAWLKSRGF